MAKVFIFIVLVMPLSAYAYLDPGSGSFIVQMAVGILAGVGYLVKAFWTSIKRFLGSLFSKKTEDGYEKKENNSNNDSQRTY